MSLVTCGFSGQPGIHAVVLPSREGRPTRCLHCPQCSAKDTQQDDQRKSDQEEPSRSLRGDGSSSQARLLATSLGDRGALLPLNLAR